MYGHALLRAYQIATKFRARALADAPAERLVDGALPGLFASKKDSRGELYIYEAIGFDCWTGSGVTSKDVVAQLDKLKGVKTLDIFINSPGGDVFEGKAIFNSLRRFDAEKTVHVDGIAASAASFIAMAGDKIVTAENATWMIHEAWGGGAGNAGDLRALADVLDQENKAIAGIYAARTGQPASSFWTRSAPSAADPSPSATGLMAEETWMGADEALAAKLTDSIEKNAKSESDEAEMEALAAKVPALRIAAATQRRIAVARARLTDTEHSVLQDRRRASPGRNAASPRT